MKPLYFPRATVHRLTSVRVVQAGPIVPMFAPTPTTSRLMSTPTTRPCMGSLATIAAVTASVTETTPALRVKRDVSWPRTAAPDHQLISVTPGGKIC